MLHSIPQFSTKIVWWFLSHNFKNPCTLTWFDATSKAGTKAAALKANYHLLASLGQNRRPIFNTLTNWKIPLCCSYSKENCNAFDYLRYIFYTKKNKTAWSLPPTSNISHGYIFRSFYVDLICWNVILKPEEFGRNSVYSVLLSNRCIVTLPEMYTYLCLQENMHCKMSVQQVWHFISRILQVHWRWMLYLSLLIQSVRYCTRYANIKFFSQPHFPVYGQDPRADTGKYVSQKTRIFQSFTQSGVFHWLSQKITHDWTRAIDIIMRINNCKEVLS